MESPIIAALKAIVYGIIEGLTEWLPVSSTGHLIILDSFFKTKEMYGSFWDFFMVIIQLAAILAVCFRFFKELNPINFKISSYERKSILRTWVKIIIGVLPAAIIGLIFELAEIGDRSISSYLDNVFIVALTLIIYGFLFIFIELFTKKKEKEFLLARDLGIFKKNQSYFTYQNCNQITYQVALIIGIAQVLSLIPGTSRSGVTILAALLVGCSRTCGAQFSFYLSIPIMLGASLVKGLSFISKGVSLNLNTSLYLVFGLIFAFITSLVVINTLLKFVKKHSFIGFGVYRIIIGILLIVLLSFNVIGGSF